MRSELSVRLQLFDYWSIKATAEVASLYKKPTRPVVKNSQGKRRTKQRAENQRKMEMHKPNPTEGTGSYKHDAKHNISQNDTFQLLP